MKASFLKLILMAAIVFGLLGCEEGDEPTEFESTKS